MASTGAINSPDDHHLIVSPRYRNRLNFQSIEADSIVANVSSNRQSTYGVNWALKQYDDVDERHGQAAEILISPRISNHIAEIEKQVEIGLRGARVSRVLAEKNLNHDNAHLQQQQQLKPCDGVCGIDLDQWSEQWPDEWRQGQGRGPVPAAIAALPASMQLLDDIERWLLEQDRIAAAAAAAAQPDDPLQQQPSRDVDGPAPAPAPGAAAAAAAAAASTTTAESLSAVVEEDVTPMVEPRPERPSPRPHPHLRGDHLPGYRHRLLTSPLLYTPAGFGPLAAQTITLRRPRRPPTRRRPDPAAARPRSSSSPAHTDYVVVNNHHQKRRRLRHRRRKRRSAEADDVVSEMNLALQDPWSTPPPARSATSSRKSSLSSYRKASIASLGESQRGFERRPKAQIMHGRLEFVIPENMDVDGSQQGMSEPGATKLTALQRYRLKQQHRKKLRDDSEKFVDELEKQLDRSEIRARFLNVVAEPRFRHRFMEHPQSTIMRSLSGEAQRFLYSESKLKKRLVQIEHRQPRRDIHNALQRIEQVRARQQQRRQMLEQQYQISLRQFNVEEALIATRQRLQQYRRETHREQNQVEKKTSQHEERGAKPSQAVFRQSLSVSLAPDN